MFSYCGLVDVRINASNKDLSVPNNVKKYLAKMKVDKNSEYSLKIMPIHCAGQRGNRQTSAIKLAVKDLSPRRSLFTIWLQLFKSDLLHSQT